jgi:hypothetical protein
MLLTKRKKAERRLLSALKAQQSGTPLPASPVVALDHDKQLAVVDAVEWAAERWATRELIAAGSADPRAAHATRLVAALVYLDARFERLDPAFVTQVIEDVTRPTPAGRRLDAKAAAALLAVEVGAFRR